LITALRWAAPLVVPEQRDQQDDRNWHADHPKQNASTESHVDLQLVAAMRDAPTIHCVKKGSMFGFNRASCARTMPTAHIFHARLGKLINRLAANCGAVRELQRNWNECVFPTFSAGTH
jgi:hypothetical protein